MRITLTCAAILSSQVEFPDAFSQQADGTLVQLNEREKIPGEHYVFRIKAPQGTRLGLLSVDQSVYLLRNKNRLTKERVSIVTLKPLVSGSSYDLNTYPSEKSSHLLFKTLL